MTHFIPVNHEKAEQLNNELGKTMFRNVEDFVNFYNSGLISKRHEDVIKFVKEITETYKDVKEKNNKLIFITENEILIEEMKNKLDYWTNIIKIKREINNLLNDNEINHEDILVFTSETNNSVSKMEDDKIVKISQEKLFNKIEDIIPCYNKYSTVKSDEAFKQSILLFKPSDLTNIDDSFVKNVESQIPKR